MLKSLSILTVFALGLILSFLAGPATAQTGNAGSIDGVVKDPSGGVVVGAKVEISFPVTGYQRETTTQGDGSFHFANIPFNPYHLTVSATGFDSCAQDVEVRSTVPISLQISLKLGTAEQSIKVEAKGEDLVEKDPSFHTDVDTSLIDRLPLESQSSSVSSLVTLGSQEWWRTRMDCSMGWGITLKIHSPWTGSRLPISRARYFRTRFRWIPSSHWKRSREAHRQNMAARRAW
jgi:hypothetical protein